MDREKGSHNNTKKKLKKEKDLHSVTKLHLEKEKDQHEGTWSEEEAILEKGVLY